MNLSRCALFRLMLWAGHINRFYDHISLRFVLLLYVIHGPYSAKCFSSQHSSPCRYNLSIKSMPRICLTLGSCSIIPLRFTPLLQHEGLVRSPRNVSGGLARH
ncbi:hypothetical protein BS47DRAFT_1049056 [Hydnum rufescens UP504]|uniref:Uncharacterized protein n=1 Tax=Hydnum rufescens UP504 TaxID=1448309 RepID=A0A9P6DVF7_9AGAM|nr:hypothetical protein BS47DRAFT_1049056 [Hydnum rufescens UP504]